MAFGEHRSLSWIFLIVGVVCLITFLLFDSTVIRTISLILIAIVLFCEFFHWIMGGIGFVIDAFSRPQHENTNKENKKYMEPKISRQGLEASRDSALDSMARNKHAGASAWYTYGVYAVVDDLKIAVCFYPDVTAACQYLHSRDMVLFLDDLAGYHEADREDRIQQDLPVGNDIIRFCLFACVCWLMEADKVAQRWIDLGSHPAARMMLSRFDLAYMDAHIALTKRTPFTLPEAKKWRRWEKQLLRYADLAAAITRGDDITPYVQEIQEKFDHRNRTYGQEQDYNLLDGCKLCPASFDILLEGILSFTQRHNGLD